MKLNAIVLAAALATISSQAFAQTTPGVQNAAARRVWIHTPRGYCGPPDYAIVPRYCYDPRDDRVDTSPYARPVAPVYGLEYGGP